MWPSTQRVALGYRIALLQSFPDEALAELSEDRRSQSFRNEALVELLEKLLLQSFPDESIVELSEDSRAFVISNGFPNWKICLNLVNNTAPPRCPT